MRILISGANGFIGKHVEQRLRQAGHATRGYDIEHAKHENVLDPYELEVAFGAFLPDVVVHLAAQVFLGPSLKHPVQDATVNILGTINMLEAARKYGARLILSSSGAVYGTNDRSNVRESHTPEPMSPYGLSKLTAEKYVLLYNDLYNMKNIVFRFSSVYGAGRKKTSVNLILDKAVRQVKFGRDNPSFPTIQISGNGNQTRDFTHVSDIAEAILMAVEAKFPPGTYNIGTGKSTSINQLIKHLEQLLKHRLVTEYIAKSKGDPLNNDFNIDLAKHYGFQAKIGLHQGLKLLIDAIA